MYKGLTYVTLEINFTHRHCSELHEHHVHTIENVLCSNLNKTYQIQSPRALQ